MERKTVTTKDIEALAKSARLNLPVSRYQLQAETMDGIFQMLDSLEPIPLSETSPAIAFRAKWGK